MTEDLIEYIILSALIDDDGTLETMEKAMRQDKVSKEISNEKLQEKIIEYIKAGCIYINYVSDNPIYIKYGVPSSYEQVWFSITKHGNDAWEKLFEKFGYIFDE